MFSGHIYVKSFLKFVFQSSPPRITPVGLIVQSFPLFSSNLGYLCVNTGQVPSERMFEIRLIQFFGTPMQQRVFKRHDSVFCIRDSISVVLFQLFINEYHAVYKSSNTYHFICISYSRIANDWDFIWLVKSFIYFIVTRKRNKKWMYF